MPLIQGGPPQWIWERTPDPLKWEVLPSQSREGHTVYEVRLNCGLEILRVQFFTREELRELRALLDGAPNGDAAAHELVRSESGSERGALEHPAKRAEGVVSDPDFVSTAG